MSLDDDVVLLGEVAKAAGVSRMTAYIWARAGEIPATFRGGRYEIQRSDLLRILRERDCATRAIKPTANAG